MTDLHIALKAAGVKLPSQLERIWVWLKDHQPQSARQIEITLKIPQASSILSQMETRRMVSSVKDLDRSSGYTTKRYSVVGRTYELLPKPKKIAKRYTPMVAPAAPVQAPQIAPPLPTTSLMATPFHHYKPLPLPPTPAAAFDLDSMTIAEARALYTRLARMFKGDMT